MSYARVIPRDLFNEASLLKCMGVLAIKLDDRVPADQAYLVDHDGSPFLIEQDPSTGAIEVTNVQLWVRRPLEEGTIRMRTDRVRLTRPLNSREPWPLYVEPAVDGDWFDPVAVFTDEGDLTDEFKQLVGLLETEGHGYPAQNPLCDPHPVDGDA